MVEMNTLAEDTRVTAQVSLSEPFFLNLENYIKKITLFSLSIKLALLLQHPQWHLPYPLFVFLISVWKVGALPMLLCLAG